MDDSVKIIQLNGNAYVFVLLYIHDKTTERFEVIAPLGAPNT